MVIGPARARWACQEPRLPSTMSNKLALHYVREGLSLTGKI